MGTDPEAIRDKVRSKLDPRWLDIAVRQRDLELTHLLARRGHAATIDFLTAAFNKSLKSQVDNESAEVLGTMIRIKHPAAADSALTAIKRYGKTSYGLYWLRYVVPKLPKEAIQELDALFPTLPEKEINELQKFVTQLKSRP
jgi:hypothetical protein